MSKEQPKAKPEIYWVLGNRTDAGKTTLATALIRVLNRNRISALGFKPFGGVNPRDIVDFMLTNYPKTNCSAYGRDAFALTEASPLTADEHVDLVAPSYMFYYPNWWKCLFARIGSTGLGNVKYFKAGDASAYLDRSDFQLLLKKSRIPISQAQIVGKLDFEGLPELAGDGVGNAFGQLAAMGPDAIVCEGASHYLPAWKDCPPANHFLFVALGTATLIPNVNYTLAEKWNGQLRSVRELGTGVETRPNACSFQINLAPSRIRKASMDQLALELLKGASLIP